MTDLEKRDDERRVLFLENCLKIAEAMGKPDGYHPMFRGNTVLYEDPHVRILKRVDTKAMEIEKRENFNPVVYTDDAGEAYRFHGEYADIADHVAALAEKL